MSRIDFETHVRAAQVEDVQFLIDLGMQLEMACARVGVKPNTVEQRLRRLPKEDEA